MVTTAQHLSHIRFGSPLFLFPGMSTSSIRLTVCPSFILITGRYHLSRFLYFFLEACTTLGCLSNVFILDLIPPCHSPHPSQHLCFCFISSFPMTETFQPSTSHDHRNQFHLCFLQDLLNSLCSSALTPFAHRTIFVSVVAMRCSTSADTGYVSQP